MNDDQYLPLEEKPPQPARTGGFADMINYVIAAILFMIMGAILTMLFMSNTVSEAELRRIVDELAVSEAEMRAAIAEVAIVDAGDAAPQAPQRIDEDLTDDDPYWGPEDALVTIVEFSDYLCPYCGRHAAQTVPLLQETYGDRVRYVYRDFPGVGGDRAYDTAMAADCAGDQGYYWEYHALLFGDQTALSAGDKDALRTLLISYADSLDLDVDQFTACFDSQSYLTDVNLDRAAGQRSGVSGTPTFFINGKILVGAQAYATFASIIDEELALASESEAGG